MIAEFLALQVQTAIDSASTTQLNKLKLRLKEFLLKLRKEKWDDLMENGK